MNYIILNGVNSNTITGLIIQELPPISKPLMRTQIDQIDGRDGDIVTKLGYSTVDKELSIGLHGNFDIDSVIEYFASEGTVIYSNELDKYYRYQVLEQIDFERLVRFRTATVTMHCQPFKYEVNEDPIEEAGSTDTTGDIVSFETQSADAVGVKVNVEPYQNLNGYDHPWVGGAGVNVLDPNIKFTSGTYNGITLTTSDGYTFTRAGTGTSSGNVQTNAIALANAVMLPAGTYTSVGGIFSLYKADGSFLGNKQIGTWTTTEPFFVKNIYFQTTAGVTVNDTQFIALVKGSTAPSAWTPYENICPIYPANGKNLLEITEPSGTGSGVTYTINPNGSVTISGTASGTSLYRFGSIPLKSGETYILSGNDSIVQMSLRDSTGGTVYVNNLETYTPTSDVNAWYFYRVASGQSVNVTLYPMVRHAEITDSAYVPYKAIGITRAGKNLLDVEGRTVNAVTYSPITIREEACTIIKNGDVLSCATTGAWSKARFGLSPQFFAQGETYTISAHFENPNANTIGITLLDKANVWHGLPSSFSNATSVDIKYTTTIDREYAQIGFVVNNANSNPNSTVVISNIQVELGSAVTSYEPYTAERYYPISDNPVYGGTLEIETGVLTVTKGAVNLGDYSWTYDSTNKTFQTASVVVPPNVFLAPSGLISDRFICRDYAYNSSYAPDNGIIWPHTSGTLRVHDFAYTDKDAFTSSVNGSILVYPLATPLVYQLTPTQVKTLLGYNNIWTDSGTVTVSVPNMISVVNEGNTTAKPTMTIYGSGNIGVWLNGMQVFQIALGDTGNITIDAEQMEAYQGGILRNRLVTGDYSNFVLQKGENTISVTGNVTNVEITNYSRWL